MDRERPSAAHAEAFGASSFNQGVEGGADATLVLWSSIGDGHTLQVIEGFVVNFENWPRWFLESGNPLGHSSLRRLILSGGFSG